VVAENLTSADAPCIDARGNFYFCDIRATPAVIWRVDAAGRLEKMFEGLGCSGLEFDAQGRLFACAFLDGQVVEIDLANRTKRVVVSGLKLNDLALGENQVAYVTETGKKQVTLVDLKSGEMRPVTQGVVNAPNGIVLVSGGRELLVSDFKGENIWRFGLLPGGGLTDGRPFAAMKLPPPEATAPAGPPVRSAKGDGMAVDARGRIYVATAVGVQVFDPAGTLLTILPKPSDRSISSCTIAGPAGDHLYITAGDRVFRTRLSAVGL
jgi:sugar lactone lactonase YvrE